MRSTTRQIIEAAAKSDGIPIEWVSAAMEILDGKKSIHAPVRLLTMQQAAERFGCTTRTVQRRIATGAIQFVRRGRLVRIPESELYD